MTKIYVKPAEGLKVRDPKDKQHVPPHGKWMARDSYTRRRLKAGDLVACDPHTDAPSAPVAAAKPTTSKQR